MTNKCFLVVLLLCACAYAQEANNENAKDVETIPQAVGQQPPASAPAQANDVPVEGFSPNNPNYGKNILNTFGIILTCLVIFSNKAMCYCAI